MAKVQLNQEHVYVPGPARKRLRIGVFFLIVFAAAGLWLLAQDGVFENGVRELQAARQTYANVHTSQKGSE